MNLPYDFLLNMIISLSLVLPIDLGILIPQNYLYTIVHEAVEILVGSTLRGGGHAFPKIPLFESFQKQIRIGC